MKIINYKSKSKLPKILDPIYEGYRSKFFKNHNHPENCAEDFPHYMNMPDIYTYDQNDNMPMPDLFDNKHEIYSIIRSFEFYKDLLLPKKYYNFSYRGDHLLGAIGLVLINCEAGGIFITTYNITPIIYDILFILSTMFVEILITKKYIICSKFIAKSSTAASFLHYIKYAMQCPKTIRPIIENTEELALKKIIKKLNN